MVTGGLPVADRITALGVPPHTITDRGAKPARTYPREGEAVGRGPNHPILTVAPDGTLTSHVGADLEQRGEVLHALTSARTFGGQDLPGTVKALAARRALQTGALDQVNAFVKEELGWWSGWREPVTTALMGAWAAPLLGGGTLTPAALDCLRAEAKEIHRQLTPLWRRKVNDERLWSLDFCFGDGMSTYDVVASGLDPYEVLTGALPDNRRIASVLTRLTPVERAVTMAWANGTSWAEAAAEVIALTPAQFAGHSPEALGDRVRRKLKRLGNEHTARVHRARRGSDRGRQR